MKLFFLRNVLLYYLRRLNSVSAWTRTKLTVTLCCGVIICFSKRVCTSAQKWENKTGKTIKPSASAIKETKSSLLTNTDTHERPSSPPTASVLVLELGRWQHYVKLDWGSGGDQVLRFWSSPRFLRIAASSDDTTWFSSVKINQTSLKRTYVSFKGETLWKRSDDLIDFNLEAVFSSWV